MNDRERALACVMRVVGGVSALGFVFVFVPYSMMNAIHGDLLGLGTLPSAPVVGYLARSTSAFYGMLGVIFIATSFDVRRYRPLIGLLVGFMAALAVVLLGVDFTESLPAWWRLAEGPFILAISVVMWQLWRGVERR
jgi:hypothetical protein